MAPDRQLVLELVLPNVSDVKTMVACTLVSTELRHHTHRAVQENLPGLISACYYDPYEPDSKPSKCIQPFQWLRGVAGESWRSSEAGCAMLEKVVNRDPRPAADFLVALGLQLTRELLMHLMRQRKHYPNLLAAYLDHKGAAANMPTVYMEAATWGWCWINGNLCRHVRKPVDYLVARVKPAQLPDVLLLLVLQAVNEQPAADAALALIQRDKDVLHVLHKGRSAGSSGASSSSQGGSGSSQQGSSGVPGWLVKWWNVSSKAARDKEKQQKQQQQQLTQQEAVRIVEEVLAVCVTYDMTELCQAMAKMPAAKHIGAAKVMQLLYVAFMQLKKRPHYTGPSMPVLEALIALPGAADVSPECFEHLMRLCVLKKDGSKLGPVLKLPCMQWLDGQQLCRLIYTVGKAGFKDLAQQLCGFAGGRSLPREDLLNLITKLIKEPWDFAYDSITRCLEAIEVLRPGMILTGEDVLTLMETCVGCSRYREGWDGLLVMAKWVPAAAAVTDVARFVAVAKLATTCWHPESGMGVVTSLLSAMQISKQLQPLDWVMLVKSVLTYREGEGFLKWVLQQQPALQHMGTGDLSELLTVAATRRRSCAAAVLAALPAAQRLGSGELAELLTTATRVKEAGETMQVIKGLPGVEQLGPAVVADALRQAVQHGGAATAEVLATLHAAQELEGAVVGGLLVIAAKHLPACMKAILPLPALGEVQPGVLAEALSALLEKMKQEGKYGSNRRACEDAFVQLCALPLAQQMAAEAVQQLLDGATDMGSEGVGLLASLGQLQQAAGLQAQLSAARLLPLLKQAVDVNSWNRSNEADENLRQLLLKPAAQEIGGADLVGLLKAAAVQKYKEAFTGLQQLRGFRQLDSKAVLGLMQWDLEHASISDIHWMEAYTQHPAAASIKAEELTQLLTKGVQKEWGCTGDKCQLLLQLPSMRQLDAEAREELVRVCIRKSDTDVLQVLLQQPGAGLIDADGAMRLLDAAKTKDYESPIYYEAYNTKALVTGLPAVADLQAEQMLKLLWAAIMLGRERVTEALVEAPVFPEAVEKGGVEFAALCGAVKLLKDRKYPDPTDD